VAGSLPAALLPATKRVTTSNNRFATQRDRYRDTSSQTSPGHDARTTTNAGLDPRASTVSQIAISASRDVVDLLAVVNVGQDYRDLLNAGNALLRPAKFESASQSAERVRPPMRGRRVSELSLADVAHPDGPEMHEFRARQVSAGSGAPTRSRNLRGTAMARPCLMKTRYSRSTVAATTASRTSRTALLASCGEASRLRSETCNALGAVLTDGARRHDGSSRP